MVFTSFRRENVNKPKKVQLVFDAAAKLHSVSFIDSLLVSPDLLKRLLGIITRFRQNFVARRHEGHVFENSNF